MGCIRWQVYRLKMRRKRRVLAGCGQLNRPFLNQSMEYPGRKPVYPTQQAAAGVGKVPCKWASLVAAVSLTAPIRLVRGLKIFPGCKFGWWGRRPPMPVGRLPVLIKPLLSPMSHAPSNPLLVVGGNTWSGWPVDFTIELYGASMPCFGRRLSPAIMRRWARHAVPVTRGGQAGASYCRWGHPGGRARDGGVFHVDPRGVQGDRLVGLRLLEERRLASGACRWHLNIIKRDRDYPDNSDRRFDAGEHPKPPGTTWWGRIAASGRGLGPRLARWCRLAFSGSLDWNAPVSILEARVRGRDRLNALRESEYLRMA